MKLEGVLCTWQTANGKNMFQKTWKTAKERIITFISGEKSLFSFASSIKVLAANQPTNLSEWNERFNFFDILFFRDDMYPPPSPWATQTDRCYWYAVRKTFSEKDGST